MFTGRHCVENLGRYFVEVKARMVVVMVGKAVFVSSNLIVLFLELCIGTCIYHDH
jgi:hypothetical protein